MLARLVDRVRQATTLDRIVIATTHLPGDDPVASLAAELDVGCYRGPVDDVLTRLRGAVNAAQASVMVQILGDNPLVPGELIDAVVHARRERQADYLANLTPEHVHAPPELARFALGIRAEAITRTALDHCDALVTSPDDREHGTSYIYGHPEAFTLSYLEATGRWAPLNRPELNLAVNYPWNLDLIRGLVDRLGPEVSVDDALSALDTDRELAALASQDPDAAERLGHATTHAGG